MQGRGSGDVDADFIVIAGRGGPVAADDAGDFDTVPDEVQLGAGFDSSGFAGNEEVACGGSQFDEADVSAVGADGAVDDNVVDTDDVNFATVNGFESAGAPGANTFGARRGVAAGGEQQIASGGQAAVEVDGLGCGEDEVGGFAAGDHAAIEHGAGSGIEGDRAIDGFEQTGDFDFDVDGVGGSGGIGGAAVELDSGISEDFSGEVERAVGASGRTDLYDGAQLTCFDGVGE